MQGAALWTGMYAVSAALHACLAALVLTVFSHRPVEQQPSASAGLSLATMTVPQSNAAEAAAIPDPASEGALSSDGIGARPIPRSQANGIHPEASAIGAIAPEVARPAPSTTTAPHLDAVAAPDERVAAASPPVQSLTENGATAAAAFETDPVATDLPANLAPSSEPLAARVASALRVSDDLVEVSAPRTPDLTAATALLTPETEPSTLPLNTSIPPSVTLAGRAATAFQVAASPAAVFPVPLSGAPANAQLTLAKAPSATLLRTSAPSNAPIAKIDAPTAPALQTALPTKDAPVFLAWSGNLSLQVPQITLETAAALRLAAPGSAGLRDALAERLADVDCARVQTVYDPDTGAIDLRGHVKSDTDRARLMESVSQQLGGALPLTDRLRRLDAPQCKALVRLAEMPLPQSVEQLTNPLIIGADLQVRTYTYNNGQTMTFDLAGADYDGWLYLDYYDSEGQVLHLMPNEFIEAFELPAQQPVTFGDGGADDPARDRFEMRVSPPFGQDIAVAMIASEPLFETVRPTVEAAAPYLEELALRVEELRERSDFRGEWVYLLIETRPGG